MIYILNSSRKFRKTFDRAAEEVEKQRKFAENYKKPIEFDYDTPVTNQEYIGMLKEKQKETKDPAMAREIEKEIKFKKETGNASGLKN